MGIQRNVNKGFKNVDTALRFIQESFNADDDIDFTDILSQLEYGAHQIGDVQAQRLFNRRADISDIVVGDGLENRFKDITNNFNIADDNTKVYAAVDKLIDDITKAKDWIMDYHLYKSKIDKLDVTGQLKTLGLAILGRAIQLCPKDTGFLRSSGSVIVTGNSVFIGFYAPYAIYVHESLNNYHPVGQAKFLENAAQEFLPNQSTWVEILGKDELFIKISATLDVTYQHYD